MVKLWPTVLSLFWGALREFNHNISYFSEITRMPLLKTFFDGYSLLYRSAQGLLRNYWNTLPSHCPAMWFSVLPGIHFSYCHAHHFFSTISLIFPKWRECPCLRHSSMGIHFFFVVPMGFSKSLSWFFAILGDHFTSFIRIRLLITTISYFAAEPLAQLNLLYY